MFGYVIPDQRQLSEEARERYRAMYCGLCRTLEKQSGLIGTATLSNDLTFLAILLTSLEEPEERSGVRHCIAHPFKRHPYTVAEALFAYAADMNVALAYHKCMDNWLDDRSIPSRTEALLLERAYARIRDRYPKKCGAIEAWLSEIHRIEQADDGQIDPPTNSTGRLLGELFAYEGSGYWRDTLRRVGDGLGRFIYLMDAYEDLDADVRRGRFNPLRHIDDREAMEELVRDGLTMAVADCTVAFEELPILQDADILRNVLYSGIWTRYTMLRQKKDTAEKEKDQ